MKILQSVADVRDLDGISFDGGCLYVPFDASFTPQATADGQQIQCRYLVYQPSTGGASVVDVTDSGVIRVDCEFDERDYSWLRDMAYQRMM